ncbi:MAG: MFS transporter [Candidatus Saccharibacteria bacterium]
MKKWIIVIVLSITQFIMVLDSTVMNVSISKVVADLNTSVSSLQAAITFYTLTMAALMLTGAKLGDKFGRLKAFKFGAVIYGVGSMITALSPSIGVLFLGWSIIEGLGAVLVIPATAALIAMHYKGKDRVVGYTAIGAASGIAVALGPLIGGYLTTYYSWRYVFVAETIIMALVFLYSFTLKEKKILQKIKLDIPSVLLSASGMVLLVFGILQSKTWGWIVPMTKPEIAGHEIAPLGISIVAYLIIIGIIILYYFYKRQEKLELSNRNPLLRVSMLKIKALRSGVAVLSGQYLITAAIFFVIPIYLQMVLGYDALETGKKIFPLSIGIVLFSLAGSKLISWFSPKKIVRIGQLMLIFGALVLTGAINPELKGFLFGASMFIVGSGLGLLASQIGNVNMSAVDDSKSSEVGGLQGTMQNLGSSLGTAIIGSVMIASLTTGFVNAINSNPDVPSSVKSQVETKSKAGIPIVTADQVESYAVKAGLSESQAQSISEDYKTSQIDSLRSSMFFLVVVAIFTLALSRNIPDKKLV